MTQQQFTVVCALLGGICGLLTVLVAVWVPILALRLRRVERALIEPASPRSPSPTDRR